MKKKIPIANIFLESTLPEDIKLSAEIQTKF